VVRSDDAADPAGSLSWSGDLYTTTGPWFGSVPFNPALVTPRKVGTMTWVSTSVTTGNLSYTVDGVAVAKSAIRQTLVNENYNGHFGAALHQVTTNCGPYNGTQEDGGVLNITQNGAAITITTLPTRTASCAYSGTLTQYGQMGDVTGIFSCTDGTAGSFHAFELQVTEYSVTGRFTASYSNPAGCQGSGWFGGLTVTTIP
jgi:hypothetical protein